MLSLKFKARESVRVRFSQDEFPTRLSELRRGVKFQRFLMALLVAVAVVGNAEF